jgi:hypothetical protein
MTPRVTAIDRTTCHSNHLVESLYVSLSHHFQVYINTVAAHREPGYTVKQLAAGWTTEFVSRQEQEIFSSPPVSRRALEPTQTRAGVSNRCVATPWCVARDHDVCSEIKKIFKLRLMMIINN